MRISKWRSAVKKLFSERKFVIISHNKVRNIPVSAPIQFVSCMAAVFMFCWGLYVTGVYFNYDSILSDKTAKIDLVSAQNQLLLERHALMQHDIKRLADGETDIKTEYEQLVLDNYADDALPEDNEALIDRLAFLEERLVSLENYRENFLASLDERTASEIKDLKKVLKITGIKVPDFKAVLASGKTEGKKEDKEAKLGAHSDDSKHQGGPFIGSVEEHSSRETVILDDVAELLVLRNIVDTLPLAKPMENARITSGYGTRRDPLTKRHAMHAGMDFAASPGTRVRSTAPGKIVKAGRQGAYGKLVEIDHGNGLRTRYGHLRSISVKVGQKVELGDKIGIQGTTGRSTGLHLHYEIRYKGKTINPNTFLKASQYVPKTEG